MWQATAGLITGPDCRRRREDGADRGAINRLHFLRKDANAVQECDPGAGERSDAGPQMPIIFGSRSTAHLDEK